MSDEPLADFRAEDGTPMDMGRLVHIDERNGDQALRLLDDAYYALGKGYNDRAQGQYGRTYIAIADFLYPDVIDVDMPDLGGPSDGPNCPPAIEPLNAWTGWWCAACQQYVRTLGDHQCSPAIEV